MTEAVLQSKGVEVSVGGWDVLDWMTERVYIKSTSGRQVPFHLNVPQMMVAAVVEKQRELGLPVRVVVLKARQHGVSSYADLDFYCIVANVPNMSALVCAHDDDASTTLFRRVRYAHDRIPPDEKLPTQNSSRKEIIWTAPHSSQFRVQTAGNVNLGRGETLQLLHISELAFWRNDEQALLSVTQAVHDLPGTAIIVESTANGRSGAFWRIWDEASKRWRAHPDDYAGWVPVFLSWMCNPEYSRAVPAGYRGGKIDEEEKVLRDTYGATREQLYWRRCVLRDKCGGDVDKFHQEYPAAPEEAFIETGRPAIRGSIRVRHRFTCTRPKLARLEWTDGTHTAVAATWGDYPEGAEGVWRVWKEPQEAYDYAMGGDVAEGVLSDQDNPKSEPDRSTVVVLEREALEMVATYAGRVDPAAFGEELAKAGIWYNQAWVGPEVNSFGLTTLMQLQMLNYPRIYTRRSSDEDVEVKDIPKYGWKTTDGNRDNLLDELLGACRRDVTFGWAGKLIVHDSEFVDEEDTFIINKRGRRKHKSGAHDDLIFACAIAYRVHKDMPRERGIIGPKTGTTYPGGDLRYLGGYDRGPRMRPVGSFDTL